MKIHLAVIFLGSILMTTLLVQAQQPPPQPSHLAPSPTTAVHTDDLEKGLLQIQLEIGQIAQDMDAVDAKMMRESTDPAWGGTSKGISKIHELIKGQNTSPTVKDFFNSPRSDIHWEVCLKTSQLYMGLLDQILKMSAERLPRAEKNRWPSSIVDESPEAVELVFMARTITELEQRYADVKSQLAAKPAATPQRPWRMLRTAIQKDDETYLEKLNALAVKTGVPMHHIIEKALSEAQNVSPATAHAVGRGMGIINPNKDSWGLGEIAGINPDFIRALDCDRSTMKDFWATSSTASFVVACSCKNYADGSSIPVFTGIAGNPSKSGDLASKTPSNASVQSPESHPLRLPPGILTWEPPNLDKVNTKADPADHPADSNGMIFKPTPAMKIPSWWIRCECPDDHSNAGMVVDGVRWHAPVLHCPNPELKLREMNKNP